MTDPAPAGGTLLRSFVELLLDAGLDALELLTLRQYPFTPLHA